MVKLDTIKVGDSVFLVFCKFRDEPEAYKTKVTKILKRWINTELEDKVYPENIFKTQKQAEKALDKEFSKWFNQTRTEFFNRVAYARENYAAAKEGLKTETASDK